MNARGLTLVEVLVALAIVGTVLVLVTQWQTQTLAITARTTTASQQLADLNDVTGYLGDRVRSAAGIRTGGFTVNAASAVNGGACDATTPCLALLSPEEEVTASGVTRRWLRVIYRVERRSTWRGADRVPDAWADDGANDVVILKEYRETCTETTATPPACQGSPGVSVQAFRSGFLDPSFSGMPWALVADHLSAVDAGGAPLTPFTYDPASRTVTLSFQSVYGVRGRPQFTPPGAPLTLSVQARNVP